MTTPDGFLKKTKSLCPTCLEEVIGHLFVRNGQVLITKSCPHHGEFSDVVDPEAELYLKCVAPPGRVRQPYVTVIPISLRCNLSCTWCYLPDREKDLEPDMEVILDMVDRCKTQYVTFSGGEPTLREDLHYLIRAVRQQFPEKVPSLLTNGIKLTDFDYLASLKEAGLGCVIFSFNGFRRETNEYFVSRDLTEEKAIALDNLKRLGIATVLSMTLAKGINDDEIKAVYEYGLRNIDFVRALRLRNVSDIGVYEKRPHFYLSEMLKTLAASIGFSLDEMCMINSVTHRDFKTGNHFTFNIFSALEARHRQAVQAEHRGESIAKLQDLAPEIYKRFWADVQRLIGADNASRMAGEQADAPLSMRHFVVELFSWPTPGNIDLSEVRRMVVNHIGPTGDAIPFLEALFANDRVRMTKSNMI